MKDIDAANIKGFPKFIEQGTIKVGSECPEFKKYNGYQFIVMEKLGMSLKDILVDILNKFCLIDTLKIGI